MNCCGNDSRGMYPGFRGKECYEDADAGPVDEAPGCDRGHDEYRHQSHRLTYDQYWSVH